VTSEDRTSSLTFEVELERLEQWRANLEEELDWSEVDTVERLLMSRIGFQQQIIRAAAFAFREIGCLETSQHLLDKVG
jgi:hypothetical protein